MVKRFEISDEDLEAWHQVSKTVDILERKEIFHPENITKIDKGNKGKILKPEKIIYTDNSSLREIFIEHKNKQSNLKNTQDHIIGNIKDLDKSTAKKIISGKFTPDAKLDLHGIGQHDSLDLVHRFIKENFASQRRKLIIVTGKGAKNNGVLKQKVPTWLNYAGVKELILLFSHAQHKDGGQGALYVLLKRRR